MVQQLAAPTTGVVGTDQDERKVKRQEKVDEAVGMLEAGVDQLMAGADFKEYLDLLAKVHDYSWGNTLLIHAQIPNPTLVMPYGDKKKTYGWKSIGRWVKKGEKGATILRPDKRWIEDEDNPGCKKQIVVGFRPAYVYDVSQTEGDPIPDRPRAKELTGASSESEGMISLLLALVDKIGWRCFDNATQQLALMGHDQAKGLCDIPNKQIFLRTGLSRDQYAKTLLHETVHAVFHSADRKFLTRSTAELEAEGSAYVVASYFGLDTSQYSFAYVTGWSGGRENFKAALKSISTTSGDMIDKLTSIGEDE